MDFSRFDALARRAAHSRRRALANVLGGALLVAGTAALPSAEPAGAKRRRVAGEHNVRGNKAIMCIDGETRKVPKKKRKAYLKQGATRGACVSPATCPTGQKSCNSGCIPTSACCTNADCASGETCQSGACVASVQRCGEGGPCLVFVSSATYTGALGGPVGADKYCQDLATAANLTGAYKAWIGDNTSTPATRFTDTSKGGPYHLVANGTDSGGVGPVVANDFAEFTSCSGGGNCLQNPIDRNETGTTLGKSSDVWTGLFATGLASSNACSNWTSGTNSAFGVFGGTQFIASGWTATENAACNAALPIYCIEQPSVT